MPHHNHHRQPLTTGNGGQRPPTTGSVSKAKLDEVLPTALVGPAQKNREPQPIVFPHLARLTVSLPAATAAEPPAEGPEQAAPPEPVERAEPVAEARGEDGGGEALVPIAAIPAVEPAYVEVPRPVDETIPIPPPPPLVELADGTGLETVSLVPQQAQPWLAAHRHLLLAGIGACGLLLVVAGVLLVMVLLPAISPVATVTLVPETSTLSTTLTVKAITNGTPDLSRQEVEARLLSVTSPLRTQTVQTTGTGHAPARAAQGLLTLYNAAPYQQTVPPGTVLVGADGVEIVTDAPAVIPAGNPPVFGVMTVLAHAVDTGPQGNIAPLDLNGLCCVAGVSVKNTAAFTGGQDAYDYPAVTQHDIEQVAGPLLAPLTQATQTSVEAQVRPNEQLLGFVGCQPTISPDHPVGSEASQVTVSVSVACRAQVYDRQATEQLVTGQLTRQAATTLGTGYALVGQVRMTISPAPSPGAKPGTLLLLASGEGTWAYQFNPAELAQLSKRIAGLSRQEALRVVQQQEAGHLHTVSIQVTGWWANGMTLPGDPARVHVLTVMGMETEQGGR